MIAVAIVGVGVGAYSWLERRSERFQEVASYHEAEQGNGYAMGTDEICRRINRCGKVVSPQADVWHREQAIKYRLAASRPWLPVDQDPPEPK
jgi:hypothetical protein